MTIGNNHEGQASRAEVLANALVLAFNYNRLELSHA